MTDLSFDAYDEDGSPRVFAGMHRPPLAEVREDALHRPAAYPFGASIYPDVLRDYWKQGECDRPLYQTRPRGPKEDGVRFS